MKLTKADLAKFLQKKYCVSVEDSSLIVEVFLETTINMAKEEGGVVLKNFGRFEFRKKTLEKNIHDFKANTSRLVEIESKKIHFIPSKNLKVKVF